MCAKDILYGGKSQPPTTVQVIGGYTILSSKTLHERKLAP